MRESLFHGYSAERRVFENHEVGARTLSACQGKVDVGGPFASPPSFPGLAEPFRGPLSIRGVGRSFRTIIPTHWGKAYFAYFVHFPTPPPSMLTHLATTLSCLNNLSCSNSRSHFPRLIPMDQAAAPHPSTLPLRGSARC